MQLRPETQRQLALAQTNGNAQVAEALVRLWQFSTRVEAIVGTGSDQVETFLRDLPDDSSVDGDSGSRRLDGPTPASSSPLNAEHFIRAGRILRTLEAPPSSGLPRWAIERERSVTTQNANGTNVEFMLAPPDDVLRLLEAYSESQAPRALDGVQVLSSPDLEGCVEGHQGIICQKCEPSYFKNAVGTCVPCPSPEEQGAWSLIQRLLIGALILLAIAGVLYNSWRSQNADTTSQAVVVAAKIMFTHIQTIGIIASVDMKFPVTMG